MQLEIRIYDIHGEPLYDQCPVTVDGYGRGWIMYSEVFHAVMVEMETGEKMSYAKVKRGVERVFSKDNLNGS